MRCPVCGADYAALHTCRGAPRTEGTSEPPRRLRFAPTHYFHEALAIARWDELAIQRASRDNNALLYGLAFFSVAAVLPHSPALMRAGLAWLAGHLVPWRFILVELAQALVLSALLLFAYFGTCHLIARFVFGARGSYLSVLRAMLLGSLVLWLQIIPVVGPLVARLWWGVAILMWVFEEVDGIERLQALAIVLFGTPLAWFLLKLVATLIVA